MHRQLRLLSRIFFSYFFGFIFLYLAIARFFSLRLIFGHIDIKLPFPINRTNELSNRTKLCVWVCKCFHSLTISRLLEIDIGIAKGSTSNYIATYTDWQYWSSGREFLEQNGFSYIRVQISYIEWRHCDFPFLACYFHTRQITINWVKQWFPMMMMMMTTMTMVGNDYLQSIHPKNGTIPNEAVELKKREEKKKFQIKIVGTRQMMIDGVSSSLLSPSRCDIGN